LCVEILFKAFGRIIRQQTHLLKPADVVYLAQVCAVTNALASAPLGLQLDAVAAKFKEGVIKKDLPLILKTLAALGRAWNSCNVWHQG